jgi:hypothetical protein
MVWIPQAIFPWVLVLLICSMYREMVWILPVLNPCDLVLLLSSEYSQMVWCGHP